jgi:hypothetical protein
MIRPRTSLVISAATATLALSACSSDDGVVTDTDTNTETAAPSTSAEDTGDTGDTEDTDDTGGEPIIGYFESLDLLGAAEIYDIFSPRADLAFFATSAGVLRLSDDVLSEVDLGCDCIVRTFDRESGFAVGTEGAPIADGIHLIYAGIYDGDDGFTPFAWGTSREGPMPWRVWGSGWSFVYTTTGGSIMKYDPNAIFNSPGFSPPGQWGEAVGDIGSFGPVWARSVGDYYVVGGTGVYHQVSNFTRVFTDIWDPWFQALDIWGHGLTVSILTRDGIYASVNNGPSEQLIELDIDEYERLIGAWFGDEPWVLGLRRDAGAGTGADPVRWGAYLIHEANGQQRRIDFPLERDLRVLAVNEAEIYVAGPGPVAYRCRFPGCDLASAVPAE